MTDSRAAVLATVHGRVQGVGYRDYVLSRARSSRLTGYVRNSPDGRSVEVLAEGPREALDRLLHHLHGGPGMSRVDRVDVDWRQPTGEFTDFHVRY